MLKIIIKYVTDNFTRFALFGALIILVNFDSSDHCDFYPPSNFLANK